MATRADRNNNPGNLRPGAGRIIWNGQTGTDADGFAVFESREAGIRAADLNLQSYAKRGLNTVSSIIKSWSTTDQATYTASVANGLGVSPTTPLDMANPQVRRSLLAQIFNVEGSATRYSSGVLSDSWADIMQSAKTGTPLDVATTMLGALGDNTSNVFGGAIDALNYPIGNKIEEFVAGFLGDSVKQYVIPFLVASGAVLIILVSSWQLVGSPPVTPSGIAKKFAFKKAGL